MTVAASVARLRRFVRRLHADNVRSSGEYSRWKKTPENERFMERCYQYERRQGMPSVTNLVRPFFHPTLPLIGLNYTQVAHVTLHHFPNGWTPAMRLCRGIVFEFDENAPVVAFPFPKFFNYGEESLAELPDEPFVATAKEDGHLGIIFLYKGELIATTRGCFVSRSSKIANQMLVAYKERWVGKFPANVTLLAEVIHPDTHVIVDYAGRTDFVVIGAYNRVSYKDYDYVRLAKLAKSLGLPVTQRWEGDSIEELLALVKDTTYRNKEGYVARFASGKRMKFKCAGYIGEMIGGKLTHRYVMHRMMEGSFAQKMSDMPGEVQAQADRFKQELMRVDGVGADKKARWQYLYNLVPEDEQTPYHKQICRQFNAWLARSPKEGEAA